MSNPLNVYRVDLADKDGKSVSCFEASLGEFVSGRHGVTLLYKNLNSNIFSSQGGGTFSVPKIREIAQALNLLANQAEAMNTKC